MVVIVLLTNDSWFSKLSNYFCIDAQEGGYLQNRILEAH
jgi:hypothetical protein